MKNSFSILIKIICLIKLGLNLFILLKIIIHIFINKESL